jgi:cellulose synthase/poly-beta-1,6-N-acetylglucosamine synthase-like glycosyltransferase
MGDLDLGLDYLAQQSSEAFLRLFWFTLCFDVPRYFCAFFALSLAVMAPGRRRARAIRMPPGVRPTVSVMVVGHNEAPSLANCIQSLREQSLVPTEIVVVSDGSSDTMATVATNEIRKRTVQHAFSTDLRAGKSAGFNLALGACQSDIIVNVDCDCSFDRFALERIVAPFLDPSVGGVSGDLVPRNGAASFIARMQEIEYLLSISIGRQFASELNQVVCVSGAFGAFRRQALEQIGGCDVGGGEDLDLTLRLRAGGWRIVFAENAICYTDVPASLWVLARQRLRWERDAIRLRLRKHRHRLSPLSQATGFASIVHQFDFLVFELGATIAFPFYIVWLFSAYGNLAFSLLLAVQFGQWILDAAILALAACIAERAVPPDFLIYLPGFSFYSGWLIRPVRLVAFIQEWFLFGSRHDNYIPAKVRLLRKW